MKRGEFLSLVVWGLALFLPLICNSCCPSGFWLDEFGNTYQILTVPTDPNDPTPRRLTYGNVDTSGFGCGVWNIRPLNSAEPIDPEYEISWIAENPNPSPYTHCCDGFRFDGNESGLGCLTIDGQYRSFGSKCALTGRMIIESQGFLPPTL